MNINWQKLSSHDDFNISWLKKYSSKNWNIQDILQHKNIESDWIKSIYLLNKKRI